MLKCNNYNKYNSNSSCNNKLKNLNKITPTKKILNNKKKKLKNKKNKKQFS